ncbi:MAG: hypothetical protein DLM56_10315 [Pseudonocardiales bacterium]|nr:MAG: hypothetical protein DLM56_10315 [Pseudonocardiales bacterium]
MNADAGPLSLLQRIAAARPATPDYERCEMCGERIGDEHGHVVSLASRSLMCTCRPCTLLFAYDSAQLHYRAVPDRYLNFPDVELSAALWDDLQIPVGLVFLFRNSALDRMVAFYPGPAGATESELPLGAWDAVAAAHPSLGVARPDVEALLLRAPEGDRSGVECFLVPIDRCYELIGRLRQGWRGFDGGQEARAQLEDFFADLAHRSRPADPSLSGPD